MCIVWARGTESFHAGVSVIPKSIFFGICTVSGEIGLQAYKKVSDNWPFVKHTLIQIKYPLVLKHARVQLLSS